MYSKAKRAERQKAKERAIAFKAFRKAKERALAYETLA